MVAGMLIIPAFSAEETEKKEFIHFFADFEDESWNGMSYANSPYASIKEENGNKFANVSLPLNTSLRVEKNLGYAVTGDFVVEADYKFNDGTGKNSQKCRRNLFQMLDSSGNSFAPISTYQGYFRTGSYVNVMKYEQNRWYNIKIVMHLNGGIMDRNYELYIDGKKYTNSASGAYLFNRFSNKDYQDVARVRFLDNWGGTFANSVQIDNAKVSQMIEGEFKFPPTEPKVDKSLPFSKEIEERYPLFQAAVNKISGHMRGFGMLAQYPSGGPKSIYVRRITKIPTKYEPVPDECYAKIFDPDGNVAAYIDLSMENQTVMEKEVKVEYGKAGIWRVSMNGGRDGDRLEIRLPKTDIWGVRGEMTLGLTETTPQTSYICMAQTTAPEEMEQRTRHCLPTGYLFLERYSISGYGDAPTINVYDENGKFLGTPTAQGSRNILHIENTPKDAIWKVEMNGYGGAIAFDGVPGLLCPTEEAARTLKGGTVDVDGYVVPGPLQARVRKEMVRMINERNFDVNVTFPEEIIEGTDVYTAAMLYCKQSPLSSIGYSIEQQILDPMHPYFGRVIRYDEKGIPLNRYSTTGFSTAIDVKSEMNPYYKNEGLINRAILSGLSYFAFVQGDDIYRIDQYKSTPYPTSDFFFAYPEMTESYEKLEEYMTEETKTLWKAMLVNLADKTFDFKSYQSNQWSHMLWSHILAYNITGEKRILRRFEEQIYSFLNNNHGPNNKWGLHEGGYFLEDYGPDGNYQSLNLYGVINAYYAYKDCPDRNEEIYQFMKKRINDALTFNSYHWLEQPDGSFKSATHFNGRTKSTIATPNYPADYMTRADFSLGLKRWLLNRETSKFEKGEKGYIGGYVAHDDEEWAKRIINAWLPHKDRMLDSTGFVFSFGGLFEAFDRPIEVEPAEMIPVDYETGTWEVPGQISWKRNKLYGLVFYDVGGSTHNIPRSLFGGGPSVFWTKGTGNIIASHANTKTNNLVENTDDLTFSCVYGEKENGTLYYTGKNEHAVLNWIEQDKSFELKAPLYQIDGELTWKYDISENQTDITVSLKANEPLKSSYVNIPLNAALEGYNVSLENGKAVFSYGENTVDIMYPESSFHELTEKLKTGLTSIRGLRLKIPSDGTGLKITIKAN